MSVDCVALIFLQQQVWWKKSTVLRQVIEDNVALHSASSMHHFQSTLMIFRHICKIAKGDHLLCHVCMSVHLYITTWLPLAGFSLILYLCIFRASVEKIQVSLKSIITHRFYVRRAVHRNIYCYSKSNQMHQFLRFVLFWINTLHVSDGLSVHHQEIKTVHTATGIHQTGTSACLLASRLQYLSDIYLLLYVQSWSPDGRKDHPKHVEC
jgi:hypothetical protein